MMHGFVAAADDDGWLHATCPCGWEAGPFPEYEDAADAYGDHRHDAMVWLLPRALRSIIDERIAQDAKWGEQNHPDFDQVLLTREGGCTPQRMAEHYEIPTENRGRNLCQMAEDKGELTWAHIAVEELAEAVGTCNEPVERLREELVQTAAVLVAWIEAIDRRES
jgi:hypothetical protein